MKLSSSYLSVPQLAERLGFTSTGVLTLIQRGTIPAEKFGGRWLIAIRDVEELERERVAKWGRVRMHAGVPRSAPAKRKALKERIAALKQRLAAVDAESAA